MNHKMLVCLCLLVSVINAEPVIMDLEVSSKEIAVYFNHKTNHFTVVGVVPFLEMHERWADGQTSMTLYGKIKPELDIDMAMQDIVVNGSDRNAAILDNVAILIQRGWLCPGVVPDSVSPKSFFYDNYNMLFLLTSMVVVSGVALGFSLGVRIGTIHVARSVTPATALSTIPKACVSTGNILALNKYPAYVGFNTNFRGSAHTVELGKQ